MTYSNQFTISLSILIAFSIISPAESKQPASTSEHTGPSIVEVKKTRHRFELIRNGEPYFIKGAGGNKHLDKLVESGGNSIRTWSASRDTLDQAHEKNLTVCMGLRLSLPRQGADYRDQEFLNKQRERIRNTVSELKDHPALLMWGVGNEVEGFVDEDIRMLVWKEIETLAKMIKEIDKNHPIITVIAGPAHISEVEQHCPMLDAVGINSYGELAYLPEMVSNKGFDKPYLITEFGPRGWWECEKTSWGLPIEDSSTEKSQLYAKGYKAAIDKRPNCVGSYVFFWNNKQEKTHTWFNLFMEDGTPTEIVDTMSYLWTGNWPENRAPKIGRKEIYFKGQKEGAIFKPSSKIEFKLQASDPDRDELTIKWDIRKDNSDNPSVGGDPEERIPPIEEAIVSAESNRVTIQMPAKPGNYRIFAYAIDPSGKLATVNLPVKVESN